MFCKCTTEHNYSVIGLCDLTKTDFGNITTTQPWTEISVPEVLSIPGCKPDVESVDKIYINAKVTSTKIIETPKSPRPTGGAFIPNPEGLILTGRKLLVDGILCQTIVYTADVPEQTVHSAHFNIPFCTFIVLPEDVDVDLDSFCVRVCIEDVYAKVLNPRSIFKNVTLFLYAEEVTNPCP